jgi:hypothetical protein
MSYFGVITHPKCGQKVTMTPEEVIKTESGYNYFCRRCQCEDAFPSDFLFKTPVGKDLPITEAIKAGKSIVRLSPLGWIKSILKKIP